ncbi:MAG: hypothetical protein NT133_03260 [Alphaproteobacteria bacterium]|nr:hypothetical protein [Alphaproteobacteria bacterium]
MAGAFLWDDKVAKAASLTATAGTSVASMPLSNLLDPQPRLRARLLGSSAGVLVDFGADTSIEAVALISTTLPADATMRWRIGPAEALVEATPLFDIRFDTGSITPPPGYNFRRASTGWCFDATGALVAVATDTPRYDHDPITLASLGLLMEEARTNAVRNPRFEGAIAGTPGTAPTYMSGLNGSGLTGSIVGAGTASGVPYVDVRIQGTASGIAATMNFETNAGITAAQGQAWSLSAFVAVVGGSLSNISSTILATNEYTGVLAYVGSSIVSGTLGVDSVLRRFSVTGTVAGATVASIMPYLKLNFASGAIIDVTLRVGLPQMELGAFATSPIMPAIGSPAATTRAVDQQWIAGMAIDGAAGMSVLVDFTGTSGGVGVIVPWSFTPATAAFADSVYLTQSGVFTNISVTLLDSVHGNYSSPPSLSATEGTANRAVATFGPSGITLACNAATPNTRAPVPTYAGVLTTMGLGGDSWGGTPGTASGRSYIRRIAFHGRQLTTGQARALAATGSSLDASVLVHDSGTIAAAAGDAANGNIVLLRSSAATGRYMQIDTAAPSASAIDLGRLVAGPVWRVSRAMAYGVTEGRLMLDRRDRNPLTGAEFPVPALANPRITRFTLPLLTNADIRAQHRTMVAALGAAGDALWIPDTGLALSELNTRCLWGAVAASGDEATSVRDHPATSNRSFRIVERL